MAVRLWLPLIGFSARFRRFFTAANSYFEGESNELAEYGYNRDGKKGKLQIVIGLLTAEDGDPLAVRVFEGNTADPSTVADQIKVLKEQFGIAEVVMVGDRGMIKAKGREALSAEGFRYITALTDAQVRTLLKQGVLQPDLFDTHLCEAEHDGKRLVVRRNDTVRVREERRRADKLKQLQEKVDERNAFVAKSSRAKAEKGLAALQRWVKGHKLGKFVTLTLEERVILCAIDEVAKEEDGLLDGCYILETDVPKGLMDAATVDGRYRDLQKVERNFRTIKTTFLEIRPIFVRKAKRTKAHVFVAMLALKITRQFEAGLRKEFGTVGEDDAAITPEDALVALGRLTYIYTTGRDGQRQARLPRPDEHQSKILDALGVAAREHKSQEPRTSASPFAHFHPMFVKLWLNASICHGNVNQHNQNRTGGRHSAAIGADGEDEHSGVAGQAFPDARELARA